MKINNLSNDISDTEIIVRNIAQQCWHLKISIFRYHSLKIDILLHYQQTRLKSSAHVLHNHIRGPVSKMHLYRS